MDTLVERRNMLVIPTGLSLPVGKALPAAVQRIVEELHPEKIVLFGSYANGNPTPDSDVDLLVIMETDLSSSQRYVAVSRLLNPRPFPVDILVKRPDELKSALEKGDFFLCEIIAHGIVLYDRQR
jgi:predicted nucleotidyltransferase